MGYLGRVAGALALTAAMALSPTMAATETSHIGIDNFGQINANYYRGHSPRAATTRISPRSA